MSNPSETMPTRTMMILIGSGLLLGVSATACGARKAEDACEDYLDAAGACVGAGIPDADCSGARAKDREYFECLRDWAEGGCMGLLTCTP